MPHGELAERHERETQRGRQESRSAALSSALQLTRTERLLLCLRYADGLNEEEISVLTRSTVAEVEVALASLVERIRTHISGR